VISLIFYRFVLQKPHFWGEEAARYLMVASLFLAISLGVNKKVHLNVDFFVNMLPEKISKYILMLSSILTSLSYGIFTIMAAKYVIAVMSNHQTSAAMNIPTWIIYCFIALGFALCTIESIIIIYADIKYLMSNGVDNIQEENDK
jgi:TRAP-type C4-dicarboxylate transport system permease small subunit